MALSFDDLLDQPLPLTPELGQVAKARSLANIEIQRRRQRTFRGAVVAAGVVTAVGSVAAMTLTSSPPATAAWDAIPQPISIAVEDDMIQQCLTGLSELPASTADSRWAAVPILAEARSESTAALLTGPSKQGICINATTSRTGAITEAPPLARNQPLSLTGNGGSVDDPEGIRYLYGRTSPKVASVEITTADRVKVTSSVADGAFMAWWPGSEAPYEVIARDSAGRVIATVHPTAK